MVKRTRTVDIGTAGLRQRSRSFPVTWLIRATGAGPIPKIVLVPWAISVGHLRIRRVSATAVGSN